RTCFAWIDGMFWMSRNARGRAGLARPPASMRPTVASALLGLPEDLGDLLDLTEQLVGRADVHAALGATGAGQLGRLVEQLVQLGVLLEVRRLEVVGPQHPQVVLDQLRPLLLDHNGAGAESGVAVGGVVLE